MELRKLLDDGMPGAPAPVGHALVIESACGAAESDDYGHAAMCGHSEILALGAHVVGDSCAKNSC